ncbi:GIY-YIG nuclease family protein [Variovorax sp. Root411]|uniref:GIY-YIG nuclease family protein n=1 Tax=Variovorax sp. Root411 TaxID=1736530 RepID=UPI0006F35AA6|nr:GIY-YIG nuclease family protein [Variovorax sp. Root411]KQW57337.1 ArsR family transcriptional regulator [Variovorax sp. Root411]
MNLSPENRRALSRQYKETARPAGVFVIRNGLNGRVYMAGSLDVEGAMNRARFELNMRSHRNKALGQDWIAHGADRFTFEVIDRVKESEDPAFDRAAELEKLLALWREELQCDGDKGYNSP